MGITRRDLMLAAVNRGADDRVRAGEDEHLVYFVLQSRTFSGRPRIEPALSAKEAIESGRVPVAVRDRIQDFLKAARGRSTDPRLNWYQHHFKGTEADVESAYRAAMRFLYAKEFGGGGPAGYERRGYSSDTSVAPCFTVWNALAVLRGLAPKERLNRVLIVGPGLDFAPRTGFRDEIPPQSYQPYLTARALVELNLAQASRLAVDCWDVNPRVVWFIEEFRRRGRRELILPPETGNPEFREYLDRLGGRVRVEAERIRAFERDILAPPRDLSAVYDLAIATNVLVYFNDREIGLALEALCAALRAGGWLIHNEMRPALEQRAVALGLPPVQGRTLEIARGAKAPLVDAFALHRKK